METETNFEAPFIIHYTVNPDGDLIITNISLYGVVLSPTQTAAFIKDYGMRDIESLCMDSAKDDARIRAEDLAINEYEIRRIA